jgi:catechol 2,3-dioxygenase-like lactoylglutathione lyase family enzyme
MIDHTGITASNLARSKSWYQAALAPIGYMLLHELPASVTGHADVVAFGDATTKRATWWVAGPRPSHGATQPPTHTAFSVATRAQVDGFYKAAVAAGGQDNGAPGVRPHYHASYYAAFVRDPDGHNIEVVCHVP